MRKMREHADEFDWAASWFRFFYRLNLFAIVLVVILIVLVVLSGKSAFPFQGRIITLGEFIANGIGGIVGGLVTAFLWRSGYILFSFLADFARGLMAQQIARERQQKQ